MPAQQGRQSTCEEPTAFGAAVNVAFPNYKREGRQWQPTNRVYTSSINWQRMVGLLFRATTNDDDLGLHHNPLQLMAQCCLMHSGNRR